MQLLRPYMYIQNTMLILEAVGMLYWYPWLQFVSSFWIVFWWMFNSLLSLLVISSKHFVDNLTYIFLIIFLRLHVCRQSLLLCFVGSALGETLGCHGGFHLVSDFEVCLWGVNADELWVNAFLGNFMEQLLLQLLPIWTCYEGQSHYWKSPCFCVEVSLGMFVVP